MERCQKSPNLKRLLSDSFLFADVDVRQADFAFGHEGCEVYGFSPQEAVFTRADFRRCLGFVVSGVLRAAKPTAGGGEVVMGRFGAGEVFGAAALFNEDSTYVSHIVCKSAAKVIFLSQGLLRELFVRDARIAENYIVYLSGRLCHLNRKIDGFTEVRAEARLARYLCDLWDAQESDAVKLPCTLSDLCRVLAIGRASLYRAMETLTEEHYIRRAGREIVFLDPEGMRALLSSNPEQA